MPASTSHLYSHRHIPAPAVSTCHHRTHHLRTLHFDYPSHNTVTSSRPDYPTHDPALSSLPDNPSPAGTASERSIADKSTQADPHLHHATQPRLAHTGHPETNRYRTSPRPTSRAGASPTRTAHATNRPTER